jgi:hypothetical protein
MLADCEVRYVDDQARQAVIDDEHLNLLYLGYMISGGATALFSLLGLIYVAIGVVMGISLSHLPAPAAHPEQQPPAFIGWFIAAIGFAFVLMLGTIALLKFTAAVCLKRRRSRTFCMVVAGISCLGVPYGTALGVLTFIVLGRESVSHLFQPGSLSPA